MKEIKSTEVIEKINSLRTQNINDFQTNYFLTPIDDEVLYAQNDKALIFLNKEKHFYKLFFAFVDLECFQELLSNLPKEEIYLEIISKTDINNDLSNVIETKFQYDTTYQKLYKKLETTQNPVCPENTINTDIIFEKIYSTFDEKYEHLMSKEELEALINDKKVITIYENDEMKSFLIYKTQGTKAYLNHIANYGTKENLIALWKKFYQALDFDGIKYLDLWYNKQNKKAENMYNIEQFQPLKMFNYCYKKL